MDEPNKEAPKKEVKLMANDVSRVVPKLATRVLLRGNDANTVLTFALDTSEDNAQVIETIAFDKRLHKEIIKLLQENLTGKDGGDNE